MISKVHSNTYILWLYGDYLRKIWLWNLRVYLYVDVCQKNEPKCKNTTSLSWTTLITNERYRSEKFWMWDTSFWAISRKYKFELRRHSELTHICSKIPCCILIVALEKQNYKKGLNYKMFYMNVKFKVGCWM